MSLKSPSLPLVNWIIDGIAICLFIYLRKFAIELVYHLINVEYWYLQSIIWIHRFHCDNISDKSTALSNSSIIVVIQWVKVVIRLCKFFSIINPIPSLVADLFINHCCCPNKVHFKYILWVFHLSPNPNSILSSRIPSTTSTTSSTVHRCRLCHVEFPKHTVQIGGKTLDPVKISLLLLCSPSNSCRSLGWPNLFYSIVIFQSRGSRCLGMCGLRPFL